ncbi:mitochondrial PLPDE III YBL036c euk domain-containing protein [Andalucia godoyi]|uniref:Pyridoxal phosphate homeostasis protein n=1 Tax=Andalucia godoyi TaxID=505711 RepID=A0A8K0AIB4_ANDGO|nr:mitochondrial PLPDE III YBL036c euk domain-containing protein [Andalucia godoyi]|eukprot:ANDGO_03157.mRNA.1 mitochondrial PLPDE III YBL036c euk domain-containing protein (possible alanine racemase)
MWFCVRGRRKNRKQSRLPSRARGLFDCSCVLQIEEEMSGIQEALKTIRNSIPKSVRLVAVSKTKPASAVLAAYDAGQRVFGENYVQELVDKAPVLPKDIQWHFIGHLQSNKAKSIVEIPNLQCVESVDREKVADALQKACEKANRPLLDVMIQVNTSGEDTKSGCDPSHAENLVRHVLDTCPALRVKGLMTIGSPNPSPPNRDFELLRTLRNQCQVTFAGRVCDLELSMGMSHDFVLAIENGSTNVRVGSSIFGNRVYTESSNTSSSDSDHFSSNVPAN